MDIQQRLAEFFRRLSAAPPAASADEAMALVCRLIEAVEDEHCPVPRVVPPPLTFTGRMYAPQADHMIRTSEGALVAETRRHRIYCHVAGSITVMRIPSRIVVLVKRGKSHD